MIANAAFLAGLTTFILVGWLAAELSFLAPYKAAIFRTHGVHILAGVGLVVLPQEPIDPAHPLLADQRVIFSPHAAFYSVASEIELRRKAAMNIVNWM